MTIKVLSKTKENVHFWNYQSFKEHHNAKIKSHNVSGNAINYIVYEVECPIDDEYTSSLGLRYEMVC